ncbi:patatin-like phospholipase family protein [Blastococcus saxobsidens]|uniref:Putative esterase of the alpha-beta hydrolase superfamily n=1 Tax=Blastococcus saxobsidens (strain DD2) TaxID=1146883 RepID=H6RKU6_BLASD|nr:patatin-like phospholipase family protein [Blastococcus saxobsidens]CCG03712.1 Putative esterase of the alpha-beta hydrolase superfamily [Blastococcus saxobsidens DD2]
MTRVGLVLGGGGVVGQAYHSGVLAVLQHDFAFDARTADVIVGTSAGSITGALLRLGVSAENLAAWTVKAPLSGTEDVLRQMAEAPVPELAPFRPWELVRRPLRLPGRHMVQRALTRPLQFRPMAAGMALMAPGRHDIVEQLAALRELEGPGWPEPDLWICAVRRRDGRRVVFGRPGTKEAPLHLAIGASCAVPGYFAPVRIGRHSYLDGGVHSPTNAAVLRGQGLDVVIVIAPMSGPAGWRPGVLPAARRYSDRLLQREVRALEAEGIRTVVFAPGPGEQQVMGTDMMSRSRLDEVVQQSFLRAGAHAATPGAAELLRAAADHGA